MEFGPHASFSDPLNLALAKERLAYLKYFATMGIATPAQLQEAADISARIAAYYQAHVAHFVNRAMGVGPYTQEQLNVAAPRDSRFDELVRETEGVN